MISLDQIFELSKKFKIAESIVAREYFQILFLNELYSRPFSDDIFFKGGTCIRLVYHGKRFSEDLDFTVNMDGELFDTNLKKLFKGLENIYPIQFKEKESITGKSYLLTAKLENLKTDIFIKLDFSFRENVIEPVRNILQSEYPIITSNFILSLSKNEIIAEKVRAIMTREKMRDLYDLWIVQELGGEFDLELVNQKLKYYNEIFDKKTYIERIDNFKSDKFITDLRPFVPSDERSKLGLLFEFVKEYCKKSVVDLK